MTITKTLIAGFAFSLALAAAAFPASARSGVTLLGYEAGAQAHDMSSSVRVKALQECNQQASKFLNYSWGDTQFDQYRACMAERGQPE